MGPHAAVGRPPRDSEYRQMGTKAGGQPMAVKTSFTCADCGGTFEKGRSDEDALAESAARFGELPIDELAVVCGDCLPKVIGATEN